MALPQEFYNKLNKSFVLKESEPGFSREIAIDSKLIEQFFTNSDSLFPNEDEMDDYNLEQAKTVEEIFYIIEKMIPDIEKQVITLLFFYKKKQEQVGRILKISQEMVYYYKKRALSRIKLHFFLRSIDIHDMEEFLVKNVTKKQKNAMIEYFKEHDLRKIAKKIAILEGKKEVVYEAIGSRITLGTLKLKELTSAKCQEVRTKAKLYFNVFSILRKYNSLYHTQSKRKISTEIHSK